MTGTETSAPPTDESAAMPADGDAALWTLSTWFSPAYPVGAYTYSHGLEAAVGERCVHDPATTRAWIADCIEHGAGRTDAILLAAAWRAAGDPVRLADVAALASALAPSAERALETEAQGAAFANVTAAVAGGADAPVPYPVAVGRAAAAAGIGLDATALIYLHAMVANLVSAAVRLVPLGQTDGQRIIAALRPLCLSVRDQAIAADLAGIGSCAFLSDIAAMRHETQDVRLFRS